MAVAIHDYTLELSELDSQLQNNFPIKAEDILRAFWRENHLTYRPLVLAVRRGRADVVGALLDSSATLRKSREALLAAIETRNSGMVALLLTKGCPVDARVSEAAIQSGCEDIVREVAEHAEIETGTNDLCVVS